MTIMAVDFGFSRETTLMLDVVDLGAGAGHITCVECEGTGNWGLYHPEPIEWDDCVVCKGTGWWLVSI